MVVSQPDVQKQGHHLFSIAHYSMVDNLFSSYKKIEEFLIKNTKHSDMVRYFSEEGELCLESKSLCLKAHYNVQIVLYNILSYRKKWEELRFILNHLPKEFNIEKIISIIGLRGMEYLKYSQYKNECHESLIQFVEKNFRYGISLNHEMYDALNELLTFYKDRYKTINSKELDLNDPSFIITYYIIRNVCNLSHFIVKTIDKLNSPNQEEEIRELNEYLEKELLYVKHRE